MTFGHNSIQIRIILILHIFGNEFDVRANKYNTPTLDHMTQGNENILW